MAETKCIIEEVFVQPFFTVMRHFNTTLNNCNMKTTKPHHSEKKASSDVYDFNGPLWSDYYERTRKTVKFPRGYKEVTLFS